MRWCEKSQNIKYCADGGTQVVVINRLHDGVYKGKSGSNMLELTTGCQMP